MLKRLYAGSVLGLDRSKIHISKMNPFARFFLDEEVDRDRLRSALNKALADCPYMKYSVAADEGVFLGLKENEAPLPLLYKEPDIINCDENAGHSCAVYAEGNMIGIVVSHVVTDGCGLFWFARTLLDRYFETEDVFYKWAEEDDYDVDLLKDEIPVPSEYKKITFPEGSYFSVKDTVEADYSNCFILKTPYAGFRNLCKEIGGSTQTVLTALSLMALSECYLEDEKYITARIPVNARNVMGVPHTFQNASVSNMRITVSNEDLGDIKTLASKIASLCETQNTKDEIAYQCNLCRSILLSESREEMLKLIKEYIDQDAIVPSNLGKGLVSDSYAGHIKTVFAGALMFPLMVYGIPVGESMGVSCYDATGKGEYKKALKAVLERMGLSINEIDPATGKTV